MLKISCIQTGSKGNCYIVEANNKMIMLDCGSPLLKNYLTTINLNKLSCVFITHKHKDHVGFIHLINHYKNIDLVCNDETYQEILRLTKNNCNLNRINDDWYQVLDVPHDAKNNGYTINFEGYKIGYFTDIGHVPEDWDLKVFEDLDVLLFEANYDENVLFRRVDIEPKLRKRLTSGLGHLSFRQSRDFINKIKTDKMIVAFIHCSEINTCENCNNEFLKNGEGWLRAGLDLVINDEKEIR